MSSPEFPDQNSQKSSSKRRESKTVQPDSQTSESQRQGNQAQLPRYSSYQYLYPSHPYQGYQTQPIPDRVSSNTGQSSVRQSYSQPSANVPRYPPPPYSGQQQSTPSQQPSPQYATQTGQQYTGHPGQQYGQPVYYVPTPTSPNVPYMVRYPPPPQDVRNSSMVRPGRRFEQRTEESREGWTGFQDKKVRAVFVRKVYIILMLQLLFTMGVIALFIFEPNVKRFVQQNKFVYFIALAIFVAVYLGMACSQSVRRKFPTNIIVLLIFTLAMSYMMGTISSFYNTEAVLISVGICAAVCLFVTIFSFYTKFDFTSCGGVICILLLVLILFGLIAIFIPSKVMTLIYAALGAVVFSLMLAYNTQMMMGGKQYELSPEEHIFAAVQLYIDIVYIFLFILMLVGGRE